MQVQALGHVVLKVRNLQRSEDFYSGTLDMRVISRLFDPRMTFFTLETTELHGACSRGLQVESSLEEFGLTRSLLDESGTPVLYEAQRGFSRSVHLLDPDGNEIELYVDI